MIICVCNRVKSADIIDAVIQGARSYEDVQRLTNVGTCCGQCSVYAQEVLGDALSADLFYNAA